MADDPAKEEVKDPAKKPDEVVEPKKLTEIELVAQKIGWNPDYEGENAIDAETFILNSKEINSNLSKKVRSITKEMEAMRQAVEVIAENSRNSVKVEVESIQDQIEQLNVEREAAVERGDSAEFKKLDAQIQKLTKKIDEKGKQPAPGAKSAEYLEWVENNGWYESDPEMRRWADMLYEKTPEIQILPRKKLLEHIGKKAREFYPEKFETPKKPEPSPEPEPKPTQVKTTTVAAPTRKTKTSKVQYTFEDLNYHQKKIAEQMVRLFEGTPKAMTLDEYAHKTLSENPPQEG